MQWRVARVRAGRGSVRLDFTWEIQTTGIKSTYSSKWKTTKLRKYLAMSEEYLNGLETEYVSIIWRETFGKL